MYVGCVELEYAATSFLTRSLNVHKNGEYRFCGVMQLGDSVGDGGATTAQYQLPILKYLKCKLKRGQMSLRMFLNMQEEHKFLQNRNINQVILRLARVSSYFLQLSVITCVSKS